MTLKLHITILDCLAAHEARAISHDYLKNRIRCQDDPYELYAVFLRKNVEGIPMRVALLGRLWNLLAMLRDPAEGFSPAQLLDRLPAFTSLRPGQMVAAKAQVHAQFLKEFDMETHERRLRKCIDRFSGQVELFFRVDTPTKSAHEAIDAAAAELITELSTLPSGVWLWPTS